MSVRILIDLDGDSAVLYCSTTMWAFGPVFASFEDAQDFLEFIHVDARSLTDEELSAKYSDYLANKTAKVPNAKAIV